MSDTKYNYLFYIAYSLPSDEPADALTREQHVSAILRRTADINESDAWREAMGEPIDDGVGDVAPEGAPTAKQAEVARKQAAMKREITDEQAMLQIHRILDESPEWSSATTDEIHAVVLRTGRYVRDLHEHDDEE